MSVQQQQMLVELMDFNLKDLYDKLNLDEEDFSGWLRSIGLLAENMYCFKCLSRMTFHSSRNKFICNARSCRSGPTSQSKPTYGARQSNLPLKTIFQLSYFWAKKFGTVDDLIYETGVSNKTVIQWSQYYRDICSEYYKAHPIQIGGPGNIVEVDETCVTKRKYNRGRLVRRQQWMVGGVERGSGRAFMVLTHRRNGPTLDRIVSQYVSPGSTVITDSWRGYNNLPNLPMGYTHLTVNHRRHFVNPITGVHSQSIESQWQKFKYMVKVKYGLNTVRFNDYINEFLWRKEFGEKNAILYNLWKKISELYPV